MLLFILCLCVPVTCVAMIDLFVQWKLDERRSEGGKKKLLTIASVFRLLRKPAWFHVQCRREDAQMESTQGVILVVITYAVYS